MSVQGSFHLQKESRYEMFAMRCNVATVISDRKNTDDDRSATNGTVLEEIHETCAMAREKYEEDFFSSNILDKSKDFPTFTSSEILKGKILGQGGFGVVYEILGFNIDSSTGCSIGSVSGYTKALGKDIVQDDGTSSSDSNKQGEEDDKFVGLPIDRGYSFKKSKDETKEDPFCLDSIKGEMETESKRLFIAKHCVRLGGDARYAIKQLKPDVVADQDKLYQGIYDMNLETRILSSLPHHPNILKLRAIAYDNSFSPDYFILLDRLYDTLDHRVQQWRARHSRVKERKGWRQWMMSASHHLEETDDEFASTLHHEQIWAAFDLSSSLAHLHKNSIIYRDLKPNNVAFDVRGDIKIFDFGLAKEIPQDSTSGPWMFTGMCGTPRYMAPEVANSQPYNQSCDVYSFSMLLWEMLAMQKPFGKITITKLQSSVWQGNFRPKLSSKWSDTIRILLENSWHRDMTKRPTMEEVETALRYELEEHGGKED